MHQLFKKSVMTSIVPTNFILFRGSLLLYLKNNNILNATNNSNSRPQTTSTTTESYDPEIVDLDRLEHHTRQDERGVIDLA